MSFHTIVGHGLAHEGMSVLGPIGKAVEYSANLAAPILIPEIGSLISMTHRGWLDVVSLVGLAAVQGVKIDPVAGVHQGQVSASAQSWTEIWNRHYYATAEIPTVTEYLEIANRNRYSDPEVADGLRRWGFVDPVIRKRMANLRYEIPGPSDMVRFSVRHVFEPDLIQYLDADAEYRPILDFFHEQQGLNYRIFTGPFAKQVNSFEADEGLGAGFFASLYAAQEVPEPTWARAYWWSHWVQPSPTMGYLMWAKLRSDRDRSFDPPEAAGLDFDLPDLELLLRANDYTPKWRKLLAAISRPVPGVRFVREFRRNNVYQFADVLEWAKRQNYAPRDALDIANDIEAWAKKAQQQKTVAKGKSAVIAALCLGVLSDQDAYNQLVTWGMDPGDAVQEVDIADVECRTRRVSKFVGSLRRLYLAGQVDDQQALNLLNQYGILPQPAQNYVTDWGLEKKTNTRQISAQKSVKWACENILSTQELQVRLTNLGYDQATIAGFTVEVGMCQAALQAKAASAQAKSVATAKRQLVATQKYHAQQIRDARRALAAHGSPKEIRKWFCEGLIGTQEVYDRLTWLGWPDIDIAREISDCKAGTPGSTAPKQRTRATPPIALDQFGEIPPVPPGGFPP